MNKTVFIIASPLETNNATKILGSTIIYSGVGKINASIAAMKAYALGYTTIINIGSCGSSNHPTGEIIEIGKAYQDIDLTPLTTYGHTLFESNTYEIELQTLIPGGYGYSSTNKTCFTTDYFYNANQRDKYSNEYLNMIDSVDAIDMECYAIAKVCNQFNINFKSIKWVSDNGDASNWELNCKISLDKVKNYLDL
tara:strand:+ start:652 stop:1236 length:585 start_codon:yes stop_codon:yes gene_type:complete